MNPNLYRNITINDNLFDGDCGLWYDVIVATRNGTLHHVCPYDRCHSFKEAIDFYYEHFHREWNTVIQCCHHKYDKETLQMLSLAC